MSADRKYPSCGDRKQQPDVSGRGIGKDIKIKVFPIYRGNEHFSRDFDLSGIYERGKGAGEGV